MDQESEHLFYDGTCGLCDRFARFVRRRDPREARFVLSPLDGEDWRRLVSPGELEALPDSAVVRLASGELLVEWAMVRHVLRRLGGVWRLGNLLLGLVPAPFGRRIYRFIAKHRGRLACKID